MAQRSATLSSVPSQGPGASHPRDPALAAGQEAQGLPVGRSSAPPPVPPSRRRCLFPALTPRRESPSAPPARPRRHPLRAAETPCPQGGERCGTCPPPAAPRLPPPHDPSTASPGEAKRRIRGERFYGLASEPDSENPISCPKMMPRLWLLYSPQPSGGGGVTAAAAPTWILASCFKSNRPSLPGVPTVGSGEGVRGRGPTAMGGGRPGRMPAGWPAASLPGSEGGPLDGR